MPVQLTNNAHSRLAVSISDVAPVVRVRAGHGGRFPTLASPDDWFPLFIEDEFGNVEIMRAVARSGDAITVLRGQLGTQRRSFKAGDKVDLRVTATIMREWFSEDGGDDGSDEAIDDEEFGGTGLIFNGLIVNAYHNEEGRQGYFHPSSGTSEGQFVFAGACYMAAQAIEQYIEDKNAAPPLALTGSLPDGVPGQAYEGRLQIENAIGAVTVKQIGGDELPAGHSIYVDNRTSEVVIVWPAAQAEAPTLLNAGFEDGTTDGWSFEYHGGQGAVSIDTEFKDEGQHALKADGGRGTGSEGGIEIMGFNDAEGPVTPGQSVSASITAMYNPILHLRGQRSRSLLRWIGENADGSRFKAGADALGALTLGKSKNKKWVRSRVIGRAPDGAAYVKVGFWVSSKTGPVWVDGAQWSMPNNTGDLEDITYSISLIITDSSGAQAEWEGTINLTNEKDILIVGYNIRSINRLPEGGNWLDVISPPLAVSRVAAEVANGRVIGIGYGSSRFCYSDDYGESWQESSGDIGRNSACVLLKGGTVLASTGAVSSSCLRSTDNGQTFSLVPKVAGIPKDPMQIAPLPDDFCALGFSDMSSYRSEDDGLTWTLGANLPAGVGTPDGSERRIGVNGETIAISAKGAIPSLVYTLDGGETFYLSELPFSGECQHVAYNKKSDIWCAASSLGEICWTDTGPQGPWHMSSIQGGNLGEKIVDITPFGRGFFAVRWSEVLNQQYIFSSDGSSFVYFDPPPPGSGRPNTVVVTKI